MRKRARAGFTILEVAVVCVIIGVLASIVLPEQAKAVAKAKRSEVNVGLGTLWRAQRAYFAQHNRYGNFDEVGFALDTRISPTSTKGGRYTYVISQPWGEGSFYCVATGNIDGDAFPDVAILESGRP